MKKICSILFICACLLGGLHVPIKAALFENDKTYDLKVNLVKKVDGLWVPSGGADMIYKDAKAEVKNNVITFKITFKKEYGTQFNIHTGNANAPVANLLIKEAEDKIDVSFTQTMQDYVKEGKYSIGNKYQTMLFDFTTLKEEGKQVEDKLPYEKNKDYFVPIVLEAENSRLHFFKNNTKLSIDDKYQATITMSINDGQTLANVVMYVDREMNHALPTTHNDKNNQVTTILPAYDKKGILYGEATIVSVGLHQKYVIAIDYTLLKSLDGNEQKDDILEDTTDNIKKNTYIMFDL